VFTAAGAFGTVEEQLARDMDQGRQEQAAGAYTLLAGAEGRGFLRLFESLGAVPIGNKDWRQTVGRLARRAAGSRLIVLPNSAEILPLAERLRDQLDGRLAVVPTKTIPQGISAVMAFDPQLGLEANLGLMGRAAGQVRTIEIRKGGAERGFLGSLDGERVAEGPAVRRVLEMSLERLSLPEPDVATVYYRSPLEAEAAGSLLRSIYPGIRVECYAGSHPVFELIISIE
jgi:dihydroxyacetone kinase-like predicted kinase